MCPAYLKETELKVIPNVGLKGDWIDRRLHERIEDEVTVGSAAERQDGTG
jgi:hypothetical protein